MIIKIRTRKDNAMQYNTKSGNITTDLKVKIGFMLPEFITTKIVTWGCNMDDSVKGR